MLDKSTASALKRLTLLEPATARYSVRVFDLRGRRDPLFPFNPRHNSETHDDAEDRSLFNDVQHKAIVAVIDAERTVTGNR